jgi:hypothetical protein
MNLERATDAGFVESTIPQRHDGVTTACPICQCGFVQTGRRKYCSDACRSAAYRRRHGARQGGLNAASAGLRPPVTVYECDGCGFRTTEEQRCGPCGFSMHRVGIGGSCPHCDEPVTLSEFLGLEVPA